MSFPIEVKDRLVAQGVGTYATNLFIGPKVVVPSLGAEDTSQGRGPYLFLRASAGQVSAKTQAGATERPSMQLVAIAFTYDDALAMATAAYNALGGAYGLYNITLSGTFYQRLVAHPLTDLTMDGASRAQVAFNIEAEKQPS